MQLPYMIYSLLHNRMTSVSNWLRWHYNEQIRKYNTNTIRVVIFFKGFSIKYILVVYNLSIKKVHKDDIVHTLELCELLMRNHVLIFLKVLHGWALEAF